MYYEVLYASPTLDAYCDIGRLNWLVAHQPLARPFMCPAYPHRFLDTRHAFVGSSIQMAMAMAVVPRPVTSGLCLEPLPTMPVTVQSNFVFVDASFKTGLVGMVFCIPGKSTRILRVSIPTRFCGDQQTAEMYGVVVALAQCLHLHVPNPVLVGDNKGTLFAAPSLKGPTRKFLRVSLLQRLSKLLYHGANGLGLVQLRWIASEWMPADFYSRNFVNALHRHFFSGFHVTESLLQHIQVVQPDSAKGTPELCPPRVWSQ